MDAQNSAKCGKASKNTVKRELKDISLKYVQPKHVSPATALVSYDSDLPTDPESISNRIHIHPLILKETGTRAGQIVIMTTSQTKELIKAGIVWPDFSLPMNSCSSDSFVPVGQEICLSSTESPTISLQTVREIKMIQISSSDVWAEGEAEWAVTQLRKSLVAMRYVLPSTTIRLTPPGRSAFLPRSFQEDGSNDSIGETSAQGAASSNQNLIRVLSVNWDTEVTIQEQTTPSEVTHEASEVERDYQSVGGLSAQIATISNLLKLPLQLPNIFSEFGLKPPRGLLLYGPPGTGKTLLAKSIANAIKAQIIVVNGPELSSAYHGGTEAALRDIFDDAKSKAPCIIILDEIDALAPRRDSGESSETDRRVVATLLTLLDGIGTGSDRVAIIGATNRPNSLDPALRRPGRLDREVEIGIPDALARLEILRVLTRKMPVDRNVLEYIADKTHGYVGADLAALVAEAGSRALLDSSYFENLKIKICSNHMDLASESLEQKKAQIQLTLPNLLMCMSFIRPSAMREVFIEKPKTTWADIGGQDNVKSRLTEMVQWPLMHPESFLRLGITAPKGVLLYGPPGCSKTLVAKALANEGGVNFIAIKGPELFNKYVGESERAVREIFKKAKAAAPSILFIDEIDAMTGARGSDVGSSDRVVASLLNEMDGIEALTGVTILAATNRPEIIDSALLRPGRLDTLLYVGPPDLETRFSILQIQAKSMAFDASVNLRTLAELTEGCSGAEVVAVCQTAAMMTLREDIHSPSTSSTNLEKAAREIPRGITQEMLAKFQSYNMQRQP